MLSIPDTEAIDLPTFKSGIAMTYTLTPGRAAGTFLAEMMNRRITGSRCIDCKKVTVPAQDFCPSCGGCDPEFVEAQGFGTISDFTETSAGIIALICIDGSEHRFPHQIIGSDLKDLRSGMRVEVVWAQERSENILCIQGFRLAPDAPKGEIRPFANPAKPVEMQPYKIDLQYEHAFGPYYGRLFDEIKTNRRIMGVRCPHCEKVMVPPREICDVCHVPTSTWVELPHTGTVRAMSVINLEFRGQRRPPPYIYAEIMLDGASTRLIHNVGGLDMNRAKELVKPGTRVRAVWREEKTGSLDDISHFEIIDQGDA